MFALHVTEIPSGHSAIKSNNLIDHLSSPIRTPGKHTTTTHSWCCYCDYGYKKSTFMHFAGGYSISCLWVILSNRLKNMSRFDFIIWQMMIRKIKDKNKKALQASDRRSKDSNLWYITNLVKYCHLIVIQRLVEFQQLQKSLWLTKTNSLLEWQ